MTNLVRINKYMAESGLCSRRKADELIANGEVKVNGVVAGTGSKINPETDIVTHKGKQVSLITERIYYAIYKPRGVVSTASDELGRKNVIDLVPRSPAVYPVGRLDKNSEGLLILTNDGELTNILTHPSNEHTKEYLVRVRLLDQNFDVLKIKAMFEGGMKIDGKIMRADSVNVNKIDNSNNLLLTIVLHTGYNRQIRKMCDKIGLEVLNLKRIRIAKLELDKLNLASGEYKTITLKEIL